VVDANAVVPADEHVLAVHEPERVRGGEADLDDPNTIEDAVVVRAVRFERFNDEPLVGMGRADLAPPHAMTLAGCCDTGQFFAIAGRRRVDFACPRRRWAATAVVLPEHAQQRTTRRVTTCSRQFRPLRQRLGSAQVGY
jgi:hypothetical protein